MKCQELYTLRSLTGFISGQELHSWFVDLVGDPSPSGRVEVPAERWAALPAACRQLYQEALGDDSSWLAVAMRYRNRAAQALCANGLLLEAEKAEREDWNINDYTDFFDRKDLPRPYAFLGW